MGSKEGCAIGHDHLGHCQVPSQTVGTECGTADTLGLFRVQARYGAIVFCSYLCLDETVGRLGGQRRALISWYKRNSAPPIRNVPWQCVEFAWAVQYAPGIVWRSLRTHLDIPMLQAGCFADERLVIGGKALHPAQKPIALMRALLLPGMQSVCDPYMGLGTMGIACMMTGRSFIGIEIVPSYFESACTRIEEAYAQPHLLCESKAVPAIQQTLL